MTLQEIIEFLDFWINKSLGAYYSIDELMSVIDRGQMAYFSDVRPKYATSNTAKEILAPFRQTYDFTPAETVSGYIVVPSDRNYLDLLDIQIEVDISSRTIYVPVTMMNEDERAIRLNSQINPVTVTSPVGEIVAPRFFRLYPRSGYTGTVTFFKRPAKPVFAYTVISQRVIVFDEANSVNLEWRETDIVAVLAKALEHVSINMPDNALAQFSEAKTQGNYAGINRL